jgi:hypothetical protein
MTQKEAAKIAGVHVNTAAAWDAQNRKALAEKELAKSAIARNKKGEGGRQNDAFKALADASGMPPVIPRDRLCKEAARGLEDFDFFRRYYMGRTPSPWQVDAAYQIVEKLRTPEREFLVVNVAPGAGKSTLFHDVAAWQIANDRRIRILFGSVAQRLAAQMSRRLRGTLERTTPFQPDEDDVLKGYAIRAEGCLAIDYGRFKPDASGSLWRADEFTVEQEYSGGLENKEATVAAYGIDSEFIGHRGELCLFDDVASPENAKESVSRDNLLQRWDDVAEHRCEPGGLLAVVGQRLSPIDLYAHCLGKVTFDDIDEDVEPDPADEPVKKHKYQQIVYKAYYEELDTGPKSRRSTAPAWPDGPLLDPRRVPWKDLSFIRNSSPSKFATLYQQEDILAGTYLIERVWATGGMGPDGVEYPGCIDVNRRPGYIPEGLEGPLISVASVDPSPTRFWAIEWWIYQPKTNLRYLVDLERTELTAEGLIGYDTKNRVHVGIMDEWQVRSKEMGYPIQTWIVEINAAQRFLLAHQFVREWQALRGVNIVPHTTGRNKLDESLGVEALLPNLWRTGQVRLPQMRENWKTLALVNEMTSWTRDKKNGTDTVMSHWQAELFFATAKPIEPPPRLWRPSWLNR